MWVGVIYILGFLIALLVGLGFGVWFGFLGGVGYMLSVLGLVLGGVLCFSLFGLVFGFLGLLDFGGFGGYIFWWSYGFVLVWVAGVGCGV